MTEGVKIHSAPRGQYSVSIDIIERVVPGEDADCKPVMRGCREAALANMNADTSDLNLGQNVDGSTRRPVIDNVRVPQTRWEPKGSPTLAFARVPAAARTPRTPHFRQFDQPKTSFAIAPHERRSP